MVKINISILCLENCRARVQDCFLNSKECVLHVSLDFSPPVVSAKLRVGWCCPSSKMILVTESHVCCLLQKFHLHPLSFWSHNAYGLTCGSARLPLVWGVCSHLCTWMHFMGSPVALTNHSMMQGPNTPQTAFPSAVLGCWQACGRAVCRAGVRAEEGATWAGCEGSTASASHGTGPHGRAVSWICFNAIEPDFSCLLSTKTNVSFWGNCRKCEKRCFPVCIWVIPRTYGGAVSLFWCWFFFFTSAMSCFWHLLSCWILYSWSVVRP